MKPSLNGSAVATVAITRVIRQFKTPTEGWANGCWDSCRENKLQWLPELGIGFFPVTDQPYDDSYWNQYRALDQTPMGAQLTQARCDLVARHWNGNVVDIGVGGGRFVGTRNNTYGFDVNPRAVAWLKEQHRWWNPYEHAADAITCWDSLEHIADPTPLLTAARSWVFVSIPIFRNVEHLLGSKHFKKSEHVWYFQERGLMAFMAAHDWYCVESGDEETKIGREDIRSYAFKRAPA